MSAESERIDAMIDRLGIPKGKGPLRSENERQNILNQVARAWAVHPEYRLGQLLSNAMGPGPQDLFYVEDVDLMKALWGLGS